MSKLVEEFKAFSWELAGATGAAHLLREAQSNWYDVIEVPFNHDADPCLKYQKSSGQISPRKNQEARELLDVFEMFPAVAPKVLSPRLEEMLNKMSFKLTIVFALEIENEPSVQPNTVVRPR